MTRQWEKTGTFDAQSEDGRTFTIEETTEFDAGEDSGGKPYRAELAKTLRTSDGEDVAWRSKGKYQIIMGRDPCDPFDPSHIVETFGSMLDIFSDDPAAP